MWKSSTEEIYRQSLADATIAEDEASLELLEEVRKELTSLDRFRAEEILGQYSIGLDSVLEEMNVGRSSPLDEGNKVDCTRSLAPLMTANSLCCWKNFYGKSGASDMHAFNRSISRGGPSRLELEEM
jgi:hypothetical protein